eukprot:sb/3477395/
MKDSHSSSSSSSCATPPSFAPAAPALQEVVPEPQYQQQQPLFGLPGVVVCPSPMASRKTSIESAPPILLSPPPSIMVTPENSPGRSPTQSIWKGNCTILSPPHLFLPP